MTYSTKEELAARAGTVIGMLLFGAWFCKSPGWDSGAAFFVAISSFIAFEYKAYKRKPNNSISIFHDIELFKKFMEDLPSTGGSIEFLKEHDFHNSFRLDNLDEIFKFVRYWDNAEKEFLDANINKARNELLYAAKEFLQNSSQKTYPEGHGWHSARFRASDKETYESMKNDIQILNELGDKVYNLHQQFIRVAKEKLGV